MPGAEFEEPKRTPSSGLPEIEDLLLKRGRWFVPLFQHLLIITQAKPPVDGFKACFNDLCSRLSTERDPFIEGRKRYSTESQPIGAQIRDFLLKLMVGDGLPGPCEPGLLEWIPSARESILAIDDEPRTKAFLDALERAISVKLKAKEGGVFVVDAGCEALPILSIYAALKYERVRVASVQGSSLSAEIATKIIKNLDLEERIKVIYIEDIYREEFNLANNSKFIEFLADKRIDIFVSNTLTEGLTYSPIHIMRQLIEQVRAPNCIIIPESITLSYGIVPAEVVDSASKDMRSLRTVCRGDGSFERELANKVINLREASCGSDVSPQIVYFRADSLGEKDGIGVRIKEVCVHRDIKLTGANSRIGKICLANITRSDPPETVETYSLSHNIIADCVAWPLSPNTTV